MKTFDLILILLAINCSCNQQTNSSESKENDAEKIKIKNSLVREYITHKSLTSISEANYYPIEKFGEITFGALIDVNRRYYNEQGNILFRDDLNSLYELVEKAKYSYDYNGNETDCRIYNSDGALIGIRKNTYEKHGYLVQSSSFDIKGILIKKEIYKYKIYNYFRNNWSNNEIEIFGIDGSLEQKVKLEYNGSVIADPSSLKVYNASGELLKAIRYEYEWDISGNWWKRVKYLDDKLNLVTTRHYVF